MHSDTVVGIVGAVVLVAVMVGVFAYEYNNAPIEDTEPTEAERMMSFNETYSQLDAMGDLDGDGTPNYQEMDLDGDGINNTEDDVFEYKARHMLTGSVGAQTPAAASGWTSSPFQAESGIMHVQLTMSSAAVVSGNTAGALSVQLAAPDGTVYSASATANGANVDYFVEVAADVPAGDYEIRVAHGQAVGAATSFTGELILHYY